jgi:hypothetical protein
MKICLVEFDGVDLQNQKSLSHVPIASTSPGWGIMQSTASSRSLHLGNRDSVSDYSRPARLNRENQQGGSRQKVRLTITVRGFLSMHKLFLAYRNWPDEARTDHVSDRIRCMCTKFETRTPSITRPSSNLTTLWPHTTPPCSPHTYVDSGLGAYFFNRQSNSEFLYRHGQDVSKVSSSAWLDNDIMSWPSRLDSVIAGGTRQQHCATTSMVWQRRHPYRLEGLMCTSLTRNLTQRFTADQALRLEEYHSNQQPNSGALYPTSLTLTWSELIVTTMIWDTSSNQLNHFLVVFYSELMFLSWFTFN